MQDKITKISIGIKYRRTFRIPNIAGDIVDFILNDTESPFGNKFFSEIADINNKGKILLNESGNTISVDYDNIILSLVVDANFDHVYQQINDIYYPYVQNILNKFFIKNFDRIGIVFEHVFEGSAVVNNLIKGLTNSEISVPETLSLRFSKKIAKETFWKKDIIDYGNVIVTYNKNLDGLNIKFDYQMHFSPEIDVIDDMPFESFSKSALEYLQAKFYNWNQSNEK